MIPFRLATLSLFVAFCGIVAAQSVYTERPGDPNAVYLTTAGFGAHGDGIADDSDALQRAIDRAQETLHHGIVFIPEGRYRPLLRRRSLPHALHRRAQLALRHPYEGARRGHCG